jgi:hypothetical protein
MYTSNECFLLAWCCCTDEWSAGDSADGSSVEGVAGLKMTAKGEKSLLGQRKALVE